MTKLSWRTYASNQPQKSQSLAAFSIAVSLKRVADAICGDADHLGLVDGIIEAIDGALLKASQR